MSRIGGMSRQEELNHVVDLFTNHFITYLNYPPLASKIYSILLISHRETGLSFKDIIKQTNSSKSSVSTSLSFLKKAKKVSYYTEEDSREKLFTAASLTDVISNYLRIFNSEKTATLAMKDFVEKYHQKKYKDFKNKFFLLYISHIDRIENLLKQTEQEFEELYKEFDKTKDKK